MILPAIDDTFVDAVVRRSGGSKASQSTDYLIGDYITKIRYLENDPNSQEDRQLAFSRFMADEISTGRVKRFANGPSDVSGISSADMWHLFFARLVKDSLTKANTEILDSYGPQVPPRGVIILVNHGLKKVDEDSLEKLMGTYIPRLSELCLGIGITINDLDPISYRLSSPLVSIPYDSKKLGDKIALAFQAEFSARS